MRKIMLLAASSSVATLGAMSATERQRGRYMRAPEGHQPSPLATLRAQRTTLVATMRGLIEAAEKENRDFTAEETATYDGHKAQLDALDARIARITGIEAAEAAGNVVVPAAARGIAPGSSVPQGPHAKTEFESFGEFMHAVRFRPGDARLNFVEGVGASDAEGGEISAELRMDNDTSGGFMVPPQLRQTLLKVEPQDALVRPRANVIPAGSPPDAAVTMPALDQSGANPKNMFGGVEVKWIGEGDEKPETDADLKSVTLTPKEVAGLVTVTDKLLRNWQAAGTFIEDLLRGATAAAEDYAFMRGNGTSMPLGAINSGAMKFVNRTTTGKITYEDTVAMLARMLMRGGSPVWSLPQEALPQLMLLRDGQGQYIWKPNAVEGMAGTLHGYPVRWNNRAPGLGTKGDVTLVDWSHYLVKDGSGPFVAASEHVLFRQNKTVIKIFWNVDGTPWLTAPIKEENGWEVSPFVGLDVPA